MTEVSKLIVFISLMSLLPLYIGFAILVGVIRWRRRRPEIDLEK